jgi:hypothetical protein
MAPISFAQESQEHVIDRKRSQAPKELGTYFWALTRPIGNLLRGTSRGMEHDVSCVEQSRPVRQIFALIGD